MHRQICLKDPGQPAAINVRSTNRNSPSYTGARGGWLRGLRNAGITIADEHRRPGRRQQMFAIPLAL